MRFRLPDLLSIAVLLFLTSCSIWYCAPNFSTRTLLSSLKLGPSTSYTLPNGMQVIVAPSKAADLVTLDMWMGAGTRRETAENNGVAHLTRQRLTIGLTFM